MEEDSIKSVPSAYDEEIVSTRTLDTISLRSVGIDDWATECFSLDELTSQTLPRVVRLAEEKPGSAPKKLESHLNCPLLLHSASQKTVVKCRVLERKDGGKYVSVGPTLVIPENYDGYFAIIPESGRIQSYGSITDVAAVMPKQFFTCSKMVAMSIVTSTNGTEKYVQRAIPEASVLKVDGVFSARWRTEADTGIYKTSKMTYTTPDIPYLKCVDGKRKTVYIPYITEGKFYTMFDKDVSDRYALYRIKDLWGMYDFPLNVRLIYGTSPTDDTKFTNLLCLNNIERVESVITSTIGLNRNVLLDIPVKTSVYVNLPVAEDNALEMDSVQTAISFANKYASSFNKRMKQSLFKMDEIAEDEDEERKETEVNNRAKSRRRLTAKIDSTDKDAIKSPEIPLDLLKDVKVGYAKSDSKESNDWDNSPHREYSESEDVEIYGHRTHLKEKTRMEFEDVDLDNTTNV